MKALIMNVKSEKDFPGYPNLIQACHLSVEKISEMGPSDNDVKMTVNKVNNQFLVTVKMMSISLAFSLQAIAQNPLSALEAATQGALFKVQRWSHSRSIDK